MRLDTIRACSADEFILRYTLGGIKPDTSGLVPVPKRRRKMGTLKLNKKEMAEFGELSTNGGNFAAKYLWSEWFNGETQIIERSEGTENAKGTITEPTVTRDYSIPTDRMHPVVKTAARKRYKVAPLVRQVTEAQKVMIAKHYPNIKFAGLRLVDAFILRARDMTPEERVKEDAKRLADKAMTEATEEGRRALKAAKDSLEVATASGDAEAIASAKLGVEQAKAELEAIRAEFEASNEADDEVDEVAA